MDNIDIKTLRKDTTGALLDLTDFTYKNANKISNWLGFIRTAMYTYKYPFSEQLQIHAQTVNGGLNPKAAASLEVWDKFGYKQKNTKEKAINIVDFSAKAPNSNPKQVYDISQMERKDGKDAEIPFRLWDRDMTPEKAESLKSVLIEKYGLNSPDMTETNLAAVLFMCLESKFVRIMDENENKFSVGENISEGTYGDIVFTAFVSAQIMLMARLGGKAGVKMDEIQSYYKMIQDNLPKINTKDTITALGEITNVFAKEMFAEIEIEVKRIDRGLENISKGAQEHEQTGLDGMGKNAAGVSEGIQQDGIPEVIGGGASSSPLHGDTEANAGVHREHQESDIRAADGAGADARQGGEPDRMGAGDELDSADGEGNSNQGTDRGQFVGDSKKSPSTPDAGGKVIIASIGGYIRACKADEEYSK